MSTAVKVIVTIIVIIGITIMTQAGTPAIIHWTIGLGILYAIWGKKDDKSDKNNTNLDKS